MLIIITISLGLSTVIALASYLLGETSPDKEKVSVYECGFTPYDNPGNPISVRFFLIGILFLVFDLEISLLFPWSITSYATSLWGVWIIFSFLLILTWGLIYEWIQGGLEWE
ncbi:NADH dehydrogenase subunit 3 (mitochondrion) [Rhopilema esculentum]|uniref:NADH-ubiquinone oxidoreductase chain 3 n=1 Tax=Rhopilema esculentum TaxID=499914 RepID=A0A222YV26_9CNID|nr:NADH dehydrogenase subunit 3 [Rhopilema esculentum]ASR75174.1 NADH dehydrogenase subunit 3 [Rhopilema esculentum]